MVIPDVEVNPFHVFLHRAVLVGDIGAILTLDIRLLVDLFHVTQQLGSTVVSLSTMVAYKLLEKRQTCEKHVGGSTW